MQAGSTTVSRRLTSPLLTDRYLLTMCFSWFHAGKIDKTATYEFFFRKNPFKADFTVLCGINETIHWLKNAKFTQEEIDYVVADLGLKQDDPFIDWLSKVDFSKLKIRAIEEGTVVFPYLTLISLEGPLGVAQLTETMILNKLNYPSLIATNARLLMACIHPAKMFEFGLRRSQGPDGGTTGAVYAYIGGASATSNVLAGMEYGVPIIGTMAHSYVTSFSSMKDLEQSNRPEDQKKFIQECAAVKQELDVHGANESELAAFISFALDFPDNFVALIDTYDTIKSGAVNYCIVAIAMERRGLKPKGVRLDSGDLAQLSIDVKAIARKLGEQSKTSIGEAIKVVASDDLNIEKIKGMKGNHEIDIFAVGTKLITCYEQAALGMVCKLCYLDPIPRLKVSETLEKSTLPGAKSVFRLTLESGESCDIITKSDEELVPGEVRAYLHQNYKDSDLQILKVLQIDSLLNDYEKASDKYVFDIKSMKDQANKKAALFPELMKGESHKRKVFISKGLKDLLFELKANIQSLSA